MFFTGTEVQLNIMLIWIRSITLSGWVNQKGVSNSVLIIEQNPSEPFNKLWAYLEKTFNAVTIILETYVLNVQNY